MSILSKNLGTIIVGGLGVAFLGYCVYFDHKRRSHPEFKKRVIEKRRRQREEIANKNSAQYPDLLDETAVQQYFMSEITKGEQLMALGDFETGVEHLANAVAVTSQKENLLNVLRSTLPDPVFRMLIERLPEVTKKIYNNYKQKSPAREKREAFNSEGPKIIDITDENLAVDDCLD